MNEGPLDQLERVIESQHGGTATLVRLVPVRETFERQTVWEGIVHVFDLIGNPKTTRAYAWSSRQDDGKRRYFAVLRVPPIKSPGDAVTTAMAVERVGPRCNATTPPSTGRTPLRPVFRLAREFVPTSVLQEDEIEIRPLNRFLNAG